MLERPHCKVVRMMMGSRPPVTHLHHVTRPYAPHQHIFHF